MESKPSVILGLDISTNCIGVSIVYHDWVNTPVIKMMTHIYPKIPAKMKGIEALITRKNIFERDYLRKFTNQGITDCVIESPLLFASTKDKAESVAKLLQFNGLISEAVYNTLKIIPKYISSNEARSMAFPHLLSIRKFNKDGEVYPLMHYREGLKSNALKLFGEFPFDCDKKQVILDLVSESFPDIKWLTGSKNEIKKENYDACDSLVCILAYIKQREHEGKEFKPEIKTVAIEEDSDGTVDVKYNVCVWGENLYTHTINLKR